MNMTTLIKHTIEVAEVQLAEAWNTGNKQLYYRIINELQNLNLQLIILGGK